MKRSHLLYAALAATLGTTAWLALQPEEAEPAVAQARPATRVHPVPAPAAAPVVSTARGPWPEPAAAALAAWSAPAPPPSPPPVAAVAAASAAPVAPAFPYQWIGRLVDDNDSVALLASAERSFGARAGDVLDGHWRIDRIAAQRLDITWLPTGSVVAINKR